MSFLSNLPQAIYCERGISSQLLAEPINAITNLAFPFLGFMAFLKLKRKGVKDKYILALPVLLSIVGVGSFIYHTTRSPFTLLFDAIPIYIFVLFSLFLVLKKLLKGQTKALATILMLVAVELVLSLVVPRDFLNGSIGHVVTIIFISLIGFFIYKKFGTKIIQPLVSVLTLYGLAIFFRSSDPFFCSYIPFGTHFLWHIFAAGAGYFAIDLVSLLEREKDSINK